MKHKKVLQILEQGASAAGPVSKLRLLGDYHHPTRIAFVEFTHADSARAALNCSGALLGMLMPTYSLLLLLLVYCCSWCTIV